MVDIQSATAEIRRRKKDEEIRKNKNPHGKKYNVRICYTQGGHKETEMCIVHVIRYFVRKENTKYEIVDWVHCKKRVDWLPLFCVW